MELNLNVGRVGVLAMVAGLTACGGGGSSSSSNTATGYPLDSAITAFFQTRHDYALKGSSGSHNYVNLRSWTPGPMKAFQGVSAFTTAQSTAISDNGISMFTDLQTKYFLTGPYKSLGGIDAAGQVFVYAEQMALPELASVGDSGKLYTVTDYTDATLSRVYVTEVVTWDLTAVTSDTAMLCFESAETATGSRSTTNSSSCYIMDQRGNITAIQDTVDLGGVQITFK
jgi:hypothetical protein